MFYYFRSHLKPGLGPAESWLGWLGWLGGLGPRPKAQGLQPWAWGQGWPQAQGPTPWA